MKPLEILRDYRDQADAQLVTTIRSLPTCAEHCSVELIADIRHALWAMVYDWGFISKGSVEGNPGYEAQIALDQVNEIVKHRTIKVASGDTLQMRFIAQKFNADAEAR